MKAYLNCAIPVLLCVSLLADFSLRAADSTVATNAPLPRTDANGNPLRRAPTGHISNYDESKVGNYTLPDPLVLANGQPVRDAQTWFKVRRPELLKIYATEIYGRVPANAPKASFKVVETDTNALGGLAIHKHVEIRFGKATNAPVAHLHIYLPANATGPVPLLLHIVFFSNPPFPDGTTNTASASPMRRPGISEGGPITNILAHGYGYATFRYTDIQPDNSNTFHSGVISLTLKPGQAKPAPDEWGTISAWAWGASRVLDYLEKDRSVDAKRVALIGHSRLGKTVLVAGARDPRFALIYSSCAGEMGSSLARRDYGETIDDMAASFPWQFAGNFQKYAGHWNDMPVDTHEIIALNAPHPVFIGGGTLDQWADPRGEFLGEVAAGPVYRLVGRQDLGTTNGPPIDTPIINGDLGFHYHTGGHTITASDWNAFLDFTDKYFKPANSKKKSMTRRFLSLLAALRVINPLRAENFSPVRIDTLTCEHLSNPVGIGNQQPRLSWKLRSDRTGEIQTAWEIRAASSASGLTATSPDLWNSGKIVSDQSVLVPWAGKPLGSRSQVFWQVRVWDKDNRPSAWSDAASFELGLLDFTNEWKGRWITADLPRYDIEQSALEKASWINAGSTASQSAAIRLAVELPTNAVVRSAFIDVAADGLITNYVNGQATHPGFTSLTAPLHVEIGGQLTPGKNIIAISSAVVRGGIRRDRGEAGRNAIAARGVIELADGQRIEFNTDSSWKAAVAPDGYWFAPDFDDSGWAAATVVAPYSEQLSKYYDITIGPGRYLRKNFAATKPIARARLYATALGVYEVSLNGQRVSDDLLAPGWTDYTKRVMVQTYDVTKLVRPGQNAVGAVLADGWYAGRLGWMGAAQYGTRPVFNAQLEITYADGTMDVIATDDSWKAGPGEIIGSDQQWGEIIDAQKAVKDWDQPTFDESIWTNAVTEEHSVALVPQLGPPVRALMELAPQKITRHGEAWIIDFGQNLVGHVRLIARGPAGTTVTVRHAETINSDGSLYTENLRTALATDKFTLGGAGRETLEPHFTFHGFRYVEITGYPGKLNADDLRAIVVGSANPPTGNFESSNPDLNRLYQNIVWSQRGNFLSVPTDCPQRDERLGWMGDAQVFAPTAARNADVSAFFTKWMVDVDDAQGANGEFTTVSPRANQNNSWPVWGDAGVIIPWAMFMAYGDKAFLADNYEHMARWVDYCKVTAPNLILSGGVGDHLAPRPTPVNIVDTAYFANSARIVAKAAALLGKTEDAAKYDALQRDITTAFNTAFVGPDGSITGVDGGRGRAPVLYTAPPPGTPRVGNTQTAYLLALQFSLLPENLRAVAAQRLAGNVETNGHLTTGFVGNGLICPVLTQIGRSDLAWELVLTNTYPSWLFSVKNGATTIWERWDGWTPERGFQDSSMNSFNHYSLGSVGAWLYSGAAGIQPDDASPGYKHFFLAPQFTARLSHVKATLDSPYGVIASGWRVEKGQILYDVTIPPNSSATLELPVPPKEINESGQPLHLPDDSVTKLPLPSGTYHFTLPANLIR